MHSNLLRWTGDVMVARAKPVERERPKIRRVTPKACGSVSRMWYNDALKTSNKDSGKSSRSELGAFRIRILVFLGSSGMGRRRDGGLLGALSVASAGGGGGGFSRSS